jgi:hypothetical protein
MPSQHFGISEFCKSMWIFVQNWTLRIVKKVKEGQNTSYQGGEKEGYG